MTRVRNDHWLKTNFKTSATPWNDPSLDDYWESQRSVGNNYPWIWVNDRWMLDSRIYYTVPRAKCTNYTALIGTTIMPIVCVNGVCSPIPPPDLPYFPPPTPPGCGGTFTIGGVTYPEPSCEASCQHATTLTISGPDNYTPGGYTANDGIGPYSWTLPSASCGMDAVTVKDYCGQQASKPVRMAGGDWYMCFDGTATLTFVNGYAASTGYESVSTTDRNTLWSVSYVVPLAGFSWSGVPWYGASYSGEQIGVWGPEGQYVIIASRRQDSYWRCNFAGCP